MPSSRLAVASSPEDEQLAMSPAPTSTGSPEGGGVVVTVIDEVAVTPLAVALIAVVPAAMPVTSPVDDTVATAELLLDQAKVLAAFGGDAVAVSCTAPPTATVADGATVTDLTPGPPRASSDSIGATGFCGRSVQESTRAIATVAMATEGTRLRIICREDREECGAAARVGARQLGPPGCHQQVTQRPLERRIRQRTASAALHVTRRSRCAVA